MVDRVKFGQARWLAVTRHPYVTEYLFTRRLVADDKLPCPVRLDDALYWNPTLFEGRSAEENAFRIAHELGHWLFDTFGRCERYRDFDERGHAVPVDRARFWFAGCLAVNEWLASTWPNHVQVCAAAFDLAPGKTTEWYYGRLPATAASQSVEGSSACACPDRVAHDRPLAAAQRAQIAQRMKPGLEPNDERLRFEARYRRQVDFAKYCATRTVRAALEAEGADHSFARLDKRSASADAARLPGKLSAARRGSVAWVLDSSGSIDDDLRARFASELRGILEEDRFDLYLVVADAKVHAAEAITHFEQAKPLIRGGGGTDFTAAFEHLAASKQRFDAVFVLTDGVAFVPLTNPLPRTQTFWVIYGAAEQPCSWGKTIRPAQ